MFECSRIFEADVEFLRMHVLGWPSGNIGLIDHVRGSVYQVAFILLEVAP